MRTQTECSVVYDDAGLTNRDGKRTFHDIRLALNDAPGTHVVTLKDMATALTREARIEAVANP